MAKRVRGLLQRAIAAVQPSVQVGSSITSVDTPLTTRRVRGLLQRAIATCTVQTSVQVSSIKRQCRHAPHGKACSGATSKSDSYMYGSDKCPGKF